MNNIIILAIQLAVAVGAFALGKYVFPNIPKNVSEKLQELSGWAAQFVVWAREFMKTSSGKEKMDKVVEQLKKIADEAGLKVTEEQLRAIAQTAYEAMMAGTKEAGQTTEASQAEPATVPAITIINHGPAAVETNGTVAVATDNVPEGALEENPDGTVNTYNEAGEKVGTATKEQVAEAERKVTTIKVE
jgi:hypothetical protein|nr:MAG TPA: holin [Caudoviricetes sp.]